LTVTPLFWLNSCEINLAFQRCFGSMPVMIAKDLDAESLARDERLTDS
jgi:hypothetical protein